MTLIREGMTFFLPPSDREGPKEVGMTHGVLVLVFTHVADTSAHHRDSR